MKRHLPDSLLSALSESIAVRTALNFPPDQWNDLERKVVSAAGDFGFTDPEVFIRWLLTSSPTREQIGILANVLTVPETYFWREPQSFEALQKHILPDLIRSRNEHERRLRIWSAGCASGEEPYSIAIALTRVLPAGEKWRIALLATDINARILQRATKGVYTEWSFRNAPPWLKERYFLPRKNGRFEIRPEIRKMVSFSYLNLAEDVYPSPLNDTQAMDLIFCRNVLMYFTPDRAEQVRQRLYRSLADGGCLIVGSSELSQQSFSQFTAVHFPGAVVYQKKPPGLQQAALLFDKTTFLPQQALAGNGIDKAASASCSSREQERTAAIKSFRQQESKSELQEVRKATAEKIVLSIRNLADRGELAQAVEACEQALTADKLDPELHYLRAIILQAQNRSTEAAAAFKAALYLDPDFAAAHFALGSLLLRQGDRRGARKCFNNLLAIISPYRREDILIKSEGLTAGRLREIVNATMALWN